MNTTVILTCARAATAAAPLLAIASVAPAQPAAANTVIPLIQFENVPLATGVENLCRQADLQYLLDPRVMNRPEMITGKWENLTAKEALERILKEHGLHRVENPATTVTRIAPTNVAVHLVDKDWIKAGTNSVIPLIQFQDVPLDDALNQLAKTAGLKADLDPRLSRNRISPGQPFARPVLLSVRFQSLTARQAIAAICENYELELAADSDGSAIKITPISR